MDLNSSKLYHPDDIIPLQIQSNSNDTTSLLKHSSHYNSSTFLLNETTFSEEIFEQTGHVIFLSFLFVFILLLNSSVLLNIVMFSREKKISRMNFFICNLAFAGQNPV
ncbi:hypothetical protein HELRODRAFT_162672 [Helobdella robusta]|uniref:G-protein coupled receptors family 1 profile domain-containing protein n=1 Tax=Helobdella robusta TaxID=6412 RepID=T1ET01_HELRO|nr:hypothetical protein HELRODRAFT_162672 [Helobdella robusta]ESN99177.1 hypothetical protein HELRODRAFT_162672 [Helobdella robusta]